MCFSVCFQQSVVDAARISNIAVRFCGGDLDATVSIGPSLCFEWSVSVAGTECWFR